METKSIAKIISYNIYNEQICASAARISTTEGNAYKIFEKSFKNENNRKLIKKVLASGHTSIMEHAVFTIAFWNVSAFVEQFFIECRLASFTVKSRRYVDFSNLGYYIPSELKGNGLNDYCQYMDILFDSYKWMLDKGIPKEDARFILPYSFNSNFYCTINARELHHVIYEMKYGRGYGISELSSLAEQLISQVKEVFPSMPFEKQTEVDTYQLSDYFGLENKGNKISFVDWVDAGYVNMIQEPLDPVKILNIAYQISHPNATQQLDLGALILSTRPRELEQVSYSFTISNITLSGITHIVRHRMQSIIIPPLQNISHSKIIVPKSIRDDSAILKQYKEVIVKTNEMYNRACENEVLREYKYYYILSGTLTDIITTMNARELMLFIQLRSCNRAQWEIRDIAIRMLKYLRKSSPELFSYLGPSCYMKGTCPEGRLTCGKMYETIQSFKKLEVNMADEGE